MTRRARIFEIAAAAALLAIAAWLLISERPAALGDAASAEGATPRAPASVSEPKPARSPGVALRRAVDPARAVVADTPAPAPANLALEPGRSPLADELHAAQKTGAQDAAVVMSLFTEYRARFRGFPVGEDNAAFVRALSGHNPGRIALLPPDHPAIDAEGQLLDRWGKPFFFHLLGRDALEIRSAGPDRQLYTADDLVKGSSQVNASALAIREN